MSQTINVSPDNLPLDIECGPDSLVDVIRAVMQCEEHIECQEAAYRPEIKFVSIDDFKDGSINPAATPFNSGLYHSHQDNAAVGSARACNKPECAPVEFPNVVNHIDEQRRDWITDKLNQWNGKLWQPIPNETLNSLILKVDEMIVSGQWAPDRPQPITISPGWNRYEIAEKQLTEMGWVFDPHGKRWVHPVPDQEAITELAREYEKREILENSSSVGYMRERIQQLEAEKQQLAQMHNQASGERDRFRALNSNQKADIDKWFDMMDKWGWQDGEPHEWLQVFVDTIVQNAQKATADANSLGERLNMRNGELQAAIDLKNELVAENKKVHAERAEIQSEYQNVQAALARRHHELVSVADTNKKLEAKVKRLQSKLKAAGL